MALCTSRIPVVQSVNFVSRCVLLHGGRRHASLFGERTYSIYGLRCVGNFSVRSTPDETTVVTVDASETTALYERNEQKSELSAGVEDGLLADGQENNGYSPSEVLDSNQPLKFLEDLDIKLDGEDVYPLLVLGGGGVVALSLLAGITGAIDSIPLVPKVLELVGLGYSLWFTTRYLIFKENRDELVGKFEQIKQQIVGSEND